MVAVFSLLATWQGVLGVSKIFSWTRYKQLKKMSDVLKVFGQKQAIDPYEGDNQEEVV